MFRLRHSQQRPTESKGAKARSATGKAHATFNRSVVSPLTLRRFSKYLDTAFRLEAPNYSQRRALFLFHDSVGVQEAPELMRA